MKYIYSLVALLAASASAVSIKEVTQPAVERQLAQVDATVDAEEGDYCPYYDYDYPSSQECVCCRKYDDYYYCPPVLDDCPGVLQPPGPCVTAICAGDPNLCYKNEGCYNTDWCHNISIDTKYPCAGLGPFGCDDCNGGSGVDDLYINTSAIAVQGQIQGQGQA